MKMDVMLQKHGAKHVYRIPEGLRELCGDISREVLRSQPNDIYRYIADYCEALITTRENARVAVRVVNNIMLGSEAIIGILRGTGLELGQIAVAAPRLQKAFGEYLDVVDVGPGELVEDGSLEETSASSIREILKGTGASSERAEKAASLIQAAFRGHYEKMVEREAKGDEVEWERAAKSTTEILKKAGVSETEAEEAATLIQSAYRGYYTRRNMRIEPSNVKEKPKRPELASADLPESRQTIQAVAWLDVMYEDSGLDPQRANEAATLIQRSYRKYKKRRQSEEARVRTPSRNSLVGDAIVEDVSQKMIEKVGSSEDNIPEEFANEERDESVAEKIETTYEEPFEESRLLAKPKNINETHEDFPPTNDGEVESAESFDSKEPKVSQQSDVSFMGEIRFQDSTTHSQHEEISEDEE